MLSGGGQVASPGVIAMSRTATYTFAVDERFRDAQYSGSWLAGRVHGRSEGRWVIFVLGGYMNVNRNLLETTDPLIIKRLYKTKMCIIFAALIQNFTQ